MRNIESGGAEHEPPCKCTDPTWRWDWCMCARCAGILADPVDAERARIVSRLRQESAVEDREMDAAARDYDYNHSDRHGYAAEVLDRLIAEFERGAP